MLCGGYYDYLSRTLGSDGCQAELCSRLTLARISEPLCVRRHHFRRLWIRLIHCPLRPPAHLPTFLSPGTMWVFRPGRIVGPADFVAPSPTLASHASRAQYGRRPERRAQSGH
jgi:hypothetical protein